MRIHSAARTDVGKKREANEDFFAIAADRGLFVVADGLGGHVAGRRASELGVHTFLESLAVAPGENSAVAMRRAFTAANAAIIEDTEQNPQYRGMGTTLACLWLRDGLATLAHVGDSRIYLERDEKLHPVTLDHSLVGEMIARRELSAEDARNHPHRHIITRALGVAPTVEPDVGVVRARPGDSFLLCSDGISAQLSDTDIADFVADSRDDLDFAADSLIAEANERGGEDNATIVLVRCYPT